MFKYTLVVRLILEIRDSEKNVYILFGGVFIVSTISQKETELVAISVEFSGYFLIEPGWRNN